MSTSQTSRLIALDHSDKPNDRPAFSPTGLIARWQRRQARRDEQWQALLARSEVLRGIAERDCRLRARCHAPFISRAFNQSTRYEILLSHYQFVHDCLPHRIRSHLLHGRDARITHFVLDNGEFAYLHMRAPTLPSAGELGLYLLDQRNWVLASCTLTFAGRRGLLIGAMHGSWPFMGKAPIRAFTRAAHGLRPKNLLLSLVYALAAFFELGAIRAVSDSARPTGSSKNWRGAGQNTFWLENGGLLDDDGCYQLPLYEKHRCSERVPSKRRAARRQREAFRDYVCEQMLFALRYAHPLKSADGSAATSSPASLDHAAPAGRDAVTTAQPQSISVRPIEHSPMLPPLKIIKRGLQQVTEALALELARPHSRPQPEWNELQWRLAMAAAAVHGVSPLLCGFSHWSEPRWQQFLASQRHHVEARHHRVVSLLKRIDDEARAIGLTLVPLKGSALHALGLYMPGERPMADIDLLVREADVEKAAALLQGNGYVESFAQWKHRVFKPAVGEPAIGLGEHRDTPVNIELHTRIHERLPISTVDITEWIYPCSPQPGLNPYPSMGALMSHLLLHAAGNICNRSLRLIHMHDISLLAARMVASDWDMLWNAGAENPPWWALPPLSLVQRYYRNAIPKSVLSRLATGGTLLLRYASRRQTLTGASCSNLWLHTLPGIEWSRSIAEAGRYLVQRFRPPQESVRERADMIRTQLWLQGQSWVTQSQRRRILTRLTRPVPRMDTMYAVRAALAPPR